MSNKILIVDDEKGVVAMLKNYFEMAGYQVYTAYNGKEALEACFRRTSLWQARKARSRL